MSGFNTTDGTDHVTQLGQDELIKERNAYEANRAWPTPDVATVLTVERRRRLEELHAERAGLADAEYIRWSEDAANMLSWTIDRMRGGERVFEDDVTLARYITVCGELFVRMRESG